MNFVILKIDYSEGRMGTKERNKLSFGMCRCYAVSLFASLFQRRQTFDILDIPQFVCLLF